VLAAALAACGDDKDQAAMVPVMPLQVRQVPWNLANQDVGKVAAVAELYEDTVVLGDQGAQVFTGGLVVATDTSARSWRGATVIPAGDLSGQWLVAIDDKGRLLRLRNRRTLEEVGDRYGLAGTPLAAVAALGSGLTGFALASDLAVADGTRVTRYPGGLTGLAGAGGRAAGLVDGGVRVFELAPGDGTGMAADPASAQVHDFAVPGAVAVTFDARARLVVATADTLYSENDGGALDRIYRSPDAPIHGLSTSGAVVWAAIGDTLAELTGAELRQSAGGTLAADARLVGSPSGDVWALESGALRRLGEAASGGGADQQLWQNTVLPIFTRVCSLCHLPGGSSGIDLSTYKAWADRRALVNQRVLVGKPSPMPPAGAGMLTDDERAALQAWIANSS
jgi:mono/diheme cytochrome c family protein